MSTRLRKVERFNADVVDHREMLRVLTSFRNGNFSVRMPVDAIGIAGKIYDALNGVIGSNERLAKELERVSNLIGKEGKINHRAAMAETQRDPGQLALAPSIRLRPTSSSRRLTFLV